MRTQSQLVAKTTSNAFESGLALLVVFLLPIRALVPPLASVVSVGTVLATVLLLVTVSAARKYRFMGRTALVYGAALISAPLLLSVATESHDINTTAAISATIVLALSLVQLCALLWARTFMGVRRVALAYGFGLVVQALLSSSSWDGNPWKFGLAFPATVIILAMLYEARRPVITVLALAGIAAFSAFNDYRSFVGFCAVVGVVFIWRWRNKASTHHGKSIFRFVAVAVAVLVIYQVTVSLALNGVLGERNQAVTAKQIAAGGSVFNAGRVESGAAWELFLARPFGYGPGVVPNADDLSAGQVGLLSSGVDLDGTYVRDYLFGEGIKLHSVISDLWVSFGVAGLALAALFAFFLLRAFLGMLVSRAVPALSIFLVTIGIWDLAFSPIGSNLHEVIFAVAMLLPLASSPAWFQPGRTWAEDAMITPLKIAPRKSRSTRTRAERLMATSRPKPSQSLRDLS